ncbi:methyltransferase domain-containing protein [Candidatus Hydrogenedentota bacterium]
MAHEFDGKKYEKTSKHQREWGGKLISELRLSGNERVLDLGCGDGAITAQIGELVPHGFVVGVDSSKGMIETAAKYVRDNIEFKLMDINGMAFEEEFDLVFSNAALHWVNDHEKLLTNAWKSLRNGGMVRFNFAADGNCSKLNEVLTEVMGRPEYAGYFEDFEWPWFMPALEEYEQLVEQTSFGEIRVWGENADKHFPDVDAITGWIDQPSIVPFLACVAEEDKQGFRDAVVDRMIEDTLQPDGTYFEMFRRINVYAKK